jgi:hypothetical protein
MSLMSSPSAAHIGVIALITFSPLPNIKKREKHGRGGINKNNMHYVKNIFILTKKFCSWRYLENKIHETTCLARFYSRFFTIVS